MKTIIILFALALVLASCSSTPSDKKEIASKDATNRYLGAINSFRK